MIVDPLRAPVSGENGCHTLHLSVAGGLTQFGAYVDTLQPGAYSSKRHWHEAEDEFLFVLEGVATVIDDDGAHDLVPDDAACWRHGDPNAHHVTNRGAAPCRYLIVGSRVAGDVCHYPDSGWRQVNGPTRWTVCNGDGGVERQGDLPPELLNLPPVWGTPYDRPMPRILRAATRQWVLEDSYAHPVLGGGLGPYSHAILGDVGGLSQFGVHLERLPAGSRSSFRHWHEAEDELVLILSGHPTLIEDQETRLNPGDMVCWPAGQATAHQLRNDGPGETLYLTLGTRLADDIIHYPDHDLITHKTGPARRYTSADGTPIDRRLP
ncbi:cupin domain-containing protein [Rhodobacter ferrooxidans]|uniref:Cupin 2 conserved barrel domain protein n=1 Tax=Rhodobacter ferrooxidans TaxID=371731 RepID=C8RXL2_9RHOB|nr:cupin domain-containing protein [Rhodobacter sp. SW2]EEW26737.1 Cupin 2 conserved barrel domain protein [Rhodobacter sp. SW2]